MALNRRDFLKASLASAAPLLGAYPAFSSNHGFPYRLSKTEIEIFPDKRPGGFSHFRIPSLIATPSDTLVAICEGRHTRKDNGDTDLLLKLSMDGGRSWSRPRCTYSDNKTCPAINNSETKAGHQTVLGDKGFFGSNVVNWRNPTSVFADGTLFLFVVVDQAGEAQKTIQRGESKYTSRIYYLKTLNPEADWHNGLIWSRPTELVLPEPFRWAQTGPGQALFHRGRLIVPAGINSGKSRPSKAFCLMSDDFGKTWQQSEAAGSATESQVVALRNGNLLLSKRAAKKQDFWVSSNNVRTWTEVNSQSPTTPTVQTGLFVDLDGRVLITALNHPTDRVDISLWASDSQENFGRWNGPLPLEPKLRCQTKVDCKNTQGYSAIAQLRNGNLVVMYEDSKKGEPYARINAAILTPVNT